MAKLFLILFTCSLSTFAQDKTHVAIQLSAMNNITATESLSGSQRKSYRIQVVDQKVTGRPFLLGLYVDQAWRSLLQDSIRVNWKPEGLHFTYSDTCLWRENGREERVPCDGQIFTAGNQIKRITQTLYIGEGRLYPEVRYVIDYDWVSLSEPRLLPVRMVLEGGREKLYVEWKDYREFRVKSELVEIDSDDGYTAPVGRVVSKQLVQVEDVPEFPVAKAFNLETVGTTEGKVKAPRRPWWKRILVIEVKR